MLNLCTKKHIDNNYHLQNISLARTDFLEKPSGNWCVVSTNNKYLLFQSNAQVTNLR
jgi:hypothetical protein